MKFIKTFENVETPIRNNGFFDLYPKKETKIFFKDRQATYELSLHDFKLDKLLFKTESGALVTIGKPYTISDVDLEKISILPVDITPESKNIVEEMFNYDVPVK